MPTLKKIPGQLTYGEALKRLETNPDDPELQELKASLERFRETFLINHPVLDIASIVQNSFQPIFRALEMHRNTMVAIGNSAMLATQFTKAMQAYKPPTYLFEAIQTLTKSFENLALPMKAIGEIYAVKATPLLYYKLPELRDNVAAPEIEPPTIVVSPDVDVEKTLAEESVLMYQETKRLQKESLTIEGRNFHYDYLRTTFVVWQTNVAALNLSSEDGSMVLLWQVFYEHLRRGGVLNDLYTEVFITMSEIVSGLIKQGKKDITDRWIINTKGNIQKSINLQNLTDLIIIEFDKDRKGYWIKIAGHVNIPIKPD